ncbi:MAG TPA: hypothetical protein VK582_15080 [Pyrinomonadaceae bacterium]|nr:hypothetical protein [Pyrinomonadaceae bacterium]
MATYIRLYADERGESHFEEVEIDLAWIDYAPPAPMLELSPTTPATQFGFRMSCECCCGVRSEWEERYVWD